MTRVDKGMKGAGKSRKSFMMQAVHEKPSRHKSKPMKINKCKIGSKNCFSSIVFSLSLVFSLVELSSSLDDDDGRMQKGIFS